MQKDRSLKAPSGTTEMSFPCKELKARESKIKFPIISGSSEKSPCIYETLVYNKLLKLV